METRPRQERGRPSFGIMRQCSLRSLRAERGGEGEIKNYLSLELKKKISLWYKRELLEYNLFFKMIKQMASRKDYYEILGITRDATAEEIEKAFRRLSRTYQFIPPSQSKAAAFCLQEITEAYEILGNKEKKEKYDRFGETWKEEDSFWEKDEEDDPLLGFEDYLEESQVLMEERKKNLPERGRDLCVTIELSFQEAIWGGEKQIKVQQEIDCPTCLGKGWGEDSPKKICSYCGGVGQIQIGFPPLTFFQTCAFCLGQGRVPSRSCSFCSGKGRLKKEELIKLQIPAGLDEECKIYLMGKGDAGKKGGTNGDLLVKVKIEKSPFFQKVGPDLLLTIPLRAGEKFLGGELEVPTIQGGKKIKIPSAWPEGGEWRVPQEGAPIFLGEGRGDLVIKAKIIVPSILDELAQRLEEWKRGQKETNFANKIIS